MYAYVIILENQSTKKEGRKTYSYSEIFEDYLDVKRKKKERKKNRKKNRKKGKINNEIIALLCVNIPSSLRGTDRWSGQVRSRSGPRVGARFFIPMSNAMLHLNNISITSNLLLLKFYLISLVC